jgi:hypothetical protein
MFRIYTKDLNGVTKIRRERQEYPIKRFDEEIKEKMYTLVDLISIINESNYR